MFYFLNICDRRLDPLSISLILQVHTYFTSNQARIKLQDLHYPGSKSKLLPTCLEILNNGALALSLSILDSRSLKLLKK